MVSLDDLPLVPGMGCWWLSEGGCWVGYDLRQLVENRALSSMGWTFHYESNGRSSHGDQGPWGCMSLLCMLWGRLSV